MIVLFEGIGVKPERMRVNLDLSGGLIMSERIMLALGERIGRQRAHDIAYEHAQAYAVQQVPFRDLLIGDEEVRCHMSGRPARFVHVHGRLRRNRA